jgi:hypothetical protein
MQDAVFNELEPVRATLHNYKYSCGFNSHNYKITRETKPKKI